MVSQGAQLQKNRQIYNIHTIKTYIIIFQDLICIVLGIQNIAYGNFKRERKKTLTNGQAKFNEI